MIDWVIICIAGFLGGILNALAGGGSFITLPALIFFGVPPVLANATSTAALLPGYIASAWRYRQDIQFLANLKLTAIILITITGGTIGATILLTSDAQIFAMLIPWLILLATTVFVVGPLLLKAKLSVEQDADSQPPPPSMPPITAGLILLCVCIYGGYFNGGLGIILLAAFGIMGQTNLHGMNGLKNVISALLTLISVIIYSAGGIIAWGPALVLGIMAVLGGYFGAAFSYKIPTKILRVFIIIVGLSMSIAFFLR